MKLPDVSNADKYKGLYVVDFGGACGVGFVAAEVAELLESERFDDVKVYKIHNAYPDGRMELKGVRRELFELEAGMLFYADGRETAMGDFERLIELAGGDVPARAKVHLARVGDRKYVTALIYPAEYDDEFSGWLLAGGYKTAGAAQGGVGAVQQYYDSDAEVIERRQIHSSGRQQVLSGEKLMATAMAATAKTAVVR